MRMGSEIRASSKNLFSSRFLHFSMRQEIKVILKKTYKDMKEKRDVQFIQSYSKDPGLAIKGDIDVS